MHEHLNRLLAHNTSRGTTHSTSPSLLLARYSRAVVQGPWPSFVPGRRLSLVCHDPCSHVTSCLSRPGPCPCMPLASLHRRLPMAPIRRKLCSAVTCRAQYGRIGCSDVTCMRGGAGLPYATPSSHRRPSHASPISPTCPPPAGPHEPRRRGSRVPVSRAPRRAGHVSTSGSRTPLGQQF